ncbi:MAG: amidohydrolase [Thermoleophilaceae bacterium]|nr:amidohydrolase [Thermoleophilaceae bacterium]
MPRTLIRGGTLLTADDARPVLHDGYLLVADDTIVDVGSGTPPTDGVDEVLDASGMLVTPGFINAHTYLCMILGRNLGTDRSLLHWLSEAQVPLALEPEDYEVSMELGAIENLKAGNTTICEVFFSPHYDQEVDALAARVLDRTGIRTVFFRCANDESFFEGFVERRDEIVVRSERLIAEVENAERTAIGVGPLVPWGSSAGSFRDAVEISRRHGARIHLHTAETPEYNALVRERTGMSNVEMLADVGALGDAVMLNHCVHLSEQDIALIADSGSHVIHDPTSNMILASGVSPVPRLREAGINVGLACDGPACNNAQDMIEAMKDAALLHKVTSGEAETLAAQDVFLMATRNGAPSIGLGSGLGALAEGHLADIVMLDAQTPHLTPMHDPLAALAYSARGADVHTVLVNGRVVVRQGEVTTLDEPAIRARANERAARARSISGV